MMIVQRSTAELELFEVGYTLNQLKLAYRESGFTDGQLFLDWASNIFVPEVLKRRAELRYHWPSVLLLDGCQAHYLDDFSQCAQMWASCHCFFRHIHVIRLRRWMSGSSEFTNVESPEYFHLTG
jgi:hypothetical protein